MADTKLPSRYILPNEFSAEEASILFSALTGKKMSPETIAQFQKDMDAAREKNAQQKAGE
jgi:hypothetical protein